MKKLLWLVGILAALAVIGYLGAGIFLNFAVKEGVNRYGSSVTGTRVELESAQISPLSGSGSLSGLTVGNPFGWSPNKAFRLKRIQLTVDPSTIFKDSVIIEEIAIDQPEFTYETKVVSSNIGDLLKNITEQQASGDTRPSNDHGSRSRKFIVRHFRLTNGQVTIGAGGAAVTLSMPPIYLSNLGTSEGGISPNELALDVMRSITENIIVSTTHAATKMGGTMGAAAGNAVKQAGDELKSLFGGGK